MKIYITIIGFAIFISSCSLLVGIKKPSPLNDDKIAFFGNKFGIDPQLIYKTDTLNYNAILNKSKSANYRLYNDFKQPLQVRVFDKNGYQVFFAVNCYVGGFPNLKWNRYGSFNTFPPDQKQFSKPDSVLHLQQEMQFIQVVGPEFKDIRTVLTGEYDLVVIVYWSRFMNRQSRRLINLAEGYKRKYPDKKIITIYVNNDNLY